jgi:RND family efflux transporter MFP subunit
MNTHSDLHGETNMNNKFWILFLIALSALTGCKQSQGQEIQTAGEKKETGAKQVTAARLESSQFTSTIEATGTALPVRESYLSFSVPGRLEAVLVRQGDRVTKGQVLMRLDRENFFLGVQQAEAALAAAKVGLDQLKLEMSRFDRLIKNKAVPRATYDKVKAQHDGTAAQYAMGEVALKQARKALRDAELRAPYDGVITDLLKEVGEFIPSMPPTMVTKVVDSSSLEVQVFLPESEAPFVKVGQEARVDIDSAQIKAEGKVIFVSDRIQPMTQNFEIRIRIENPEGKIKAGAYSRVELDRNSTNDAVFVPLRAVKREADGEAYVYVAKGGKAKKTKVELGETRADLTLIHCCLKAGQLVITSGLAEISDGDPVVATTD